jgi:hypothetical protein
MGLDWNPLERPRPGHEAEFERLFRESLSASGPRRDSIAKRFQEVAQPPFELLGAPRVGIDAAAADWLREKVAASGHPERFAEARASMHGYYVLDLLPACDGFPVYSSYGMYEGVDRYSFRGEFLLIAEDALGQELIERAYTPMLAAGLERYGEELLARARVYAEKHGVEHTERAEPPEFDEDAPATRAHVVFAAAKWCLYWARRGHGMEPWF